jgi:predicted TIM-barrel fold metal-dependent hydrolase
MGSKKKVSKYLSPSFINIKYSYFALLKSYFTYLILAAAIQMTVLPAFCQDPDNKKASTLKLEDYKPESIFNTPRTKVLKAKYPVIDLHSHDYPPTDAGVDKWVETMDEAGIERTMILSCSSGHGFDSVVKKYSRYKDRFTIWCGFDYTGFGKPGWQQQAVAELGRCYKEGARGVGELGDKGLGELYSKPTPGRGIHVDNSLLKPLFEKCAELHMPVSIHAAEDAWMYLAPDSTNDGLMNAAKWNVDLTRKGILHHDELIATLENVVRDNPKTIFIACHYANSCSDLSVLARLLDTYPNLYADIAARYGELATVPRYAQAFIEKYAGRLVYGTDMGTAPEMYHTTFRILETADEHFYDRELFNYHWPLYGFSLSDEALKKIYHDNAEKIMRL